MKLAKKTGFTVFWNCKCGETESGWEQKISAIILKRYRAVFSDWEPVTVIKELFPASVHTPTFNVDEESIEIE
jgi:hypothetical protein